MDPEVKDAHGKPFGPGVYYCGLELPHNVSPIIINKLATTTNFNKWLKSKVGMRMVKKGGTTGISVKKRPAVGPPSTSPLKGAAAVNKMFGKQPTLAVTTGGSGGSSVQRVYRQVVTLFFSVANLQRLLVAALLFTMSAANIMTNPFMKLFLLCATGGVLSGCDKSTITKIEEEFFAQLEENIKQRLIAAGVMKPDGSGPVLAKLPKYSLSCDKSTTDIEGWQTITLNMFFMFKGVRSKINLGVLKFQLSNDATVSKGTGKNIAEFIVRRLLSVKLLNS